VKDEHRNLVGLLQPHVIPGSKWDVLSMDFIVAFPLMARTHNSIFVVVDTLIKSLHFIPVRTTYQSVEITIMFVNEIVILQGVPIKIIYDQGLVFIG